MSHITMNSESQGNENEIDTDHVSSPSNGQTPENEKEEEQDVDEEGLLKNGYDVILCGTGLTQSILAAALARVGKSVLHCDSNEFYGDLDAVHSLGSLRDWSSKVANRVSCSYSTSGGEEEQQDDGNFIGLEPSECYSSLTIDSESNVGTDHNDVVHWKKGMKVVTQYGIGTLLVTPNTTGNDESIQSLHVELEDWILANGKHAIVFIGRRNQMENSWDIIPHDAILYQRYVEEKQRSFALDIAPRVILANGEAVDGIVHCGVNEYCEFKSILGLHLFKSAGATASTSATTRVPTAANKETNHDDVPILHRVPCSKRDVFQTKLLSPMDKRRLMKFLQIAADYAVSLSLSSHDNDNHEKEGNDNHDIDDEKLMNEENVDSKPVAVGEDVVLSLNERQLRQGRSLYRPQNKTVATTDMETLQQCIQDDMSFEYYLKKHHKLSDDMIKIIIYAMAMGSSTKKTCEYSTKDGMRDLCKHLQSLGKYGSTAFLTPLYGSGELSQAFCRCAAVHGGTFVLRKSPTRINLDENGAVYGVTLRDNEDDDGSSIGTSEKLIRAKHVVVSSQMMIHPQKKQQQQHGQKTCRIYRRLSILRGQIVVTTPTDQQQHSNTNNEQRHIIIIPPDDQRLGNEYAIHGLVLDESVNIAPRSMSGTVPITALYLSTIGYANDGDNSCDDDSVNVLHNAAQTLYGKNCVELYHVSYSYNIYDQEQQQIPHHFSNKHGLHVCQPWRDGTLIVDNSFVEAKRVFEQICPNESFLMLSSEMDKLLKERRAGMQDDADDEVQMLESAMSMVKASDLIE
mmetsp:Transcript_2401/g.4455  ORF Transcript_2401/g.4455 Transcript_2401/m.4455 type:complete len:797 (+) Transcript_2401:128-2518(+)